LAKTATPRLSKKLVAGCGPTQELSASLTSFARVCDLLFLINDEVAAAISPTNNTESSPSYAVAAFFLSLIAFLCGYFS
jgi:hypothetical protein